LYELISDLRPYFYSLREVKQQNVCLDIRIPINWKLEQINQVIEQYKSVEYKVQDKTDKNILISIVSSADEEGYNIARSCAMEIITYNKELEEKERLFKIKQRELQELYQKQLKELEDTFKNEPLDKLKDPNFRTGDGQEDSTRIELAGEGDEEGQ
jgi:hypothetical protein